MYGMGDNVFSWLKEEVESIALSPALFSKQRDALNYQECKGFAL